MLLAFDISQYNEQIKAVVFLVAAAWGVVKAVSACSISCTHSSPERSVCTCCTISLTEPRTGSHWQDMLLNDDRNDSVFGVQLCP
ncbi:hypothetical protein FKM82_008640 [Ascaphus truei]